MSRTVAIVLTILAGFICGVPGLVSFCSGAFGMVGVYFVQVGFEGTSQEAIARLPISVCGGLFLLLIPVGVGLLSFRLSARPEASSPDNSD